MNSLEIYQTIFSALLGRQMNSLEHSALLSRYPNEKSSPTLDRVVSEVLLSDEFHLRHRENFIDKLFPRSCVVAASTPLGDEVFTDLRQLHLGLAIATGNFEPDETAFVRKTIRRGQFVVDIGANIGYYTTMFGRLVGENGFVYAFEPIEDTYTKLVSAVRRAGLDHIVRPLKMALSSVQGTAKMAFSSNSMNIGGAHMLSTHDDAALMCVEEVEQDTLDRMIAGRKVDFLKIDVEGAEKLILNGGYSVFKAGIPNTLIEFNRDQLLAVSGVEPKELLNEFLNLGYTAHRLLVEGETAPLREPEAELMIMLEKTGIVNLVLRAD
jgi:FkbM family methyltransferase